jgi:hypothetical protein
MSKFRRWIEADKLMERWEIGPLDLTDYVLESKLIAYSRSRYPYPHDLKYDLIYDEEDSFEKSAEYYYENNEDIGKYVFIGDRINEFIFKYEDILLFEKEFTDNYQNTPDNKEKPLRTNQSHKERCRALAAYLWDKFPDTTIEDMIKSDALIKFGCENKDPLYHPKTLRKWIHDLCPNNKPGRRPDAE